MYIRPFKQESTRSQQRRVSRELRELRDLYRPSKRFKGNFDIEFTEYIKNQDLYASGFGGRDPYNRYVNDCEDEDGWETLSASSLSSECSTLSWGTTAVFTDIQEKNSPPRITSLNQGLPVPVVPLVIEVSDTNSVKSELSTHLDFIVRPVGSTLVPCRVPYNRIDTKYDFRYFVPKALGFLPDPDVSRLRLTPWFLDRPDSPNFETDTYSGDSDNSDIVVLPISNNYELPDDQKYQNLDEEFRNTSHEFEGDFEEDEEVESCIEALREYLDIVGEKEKTIVSVDDYGIDKWSTRLQSIRTPY